MVIRFLLLQSETIKNYYFFIFIFIFIIIFIIVFFILSSFFSFLFITFCHQTSFFSFATSFFSFATYFFFHFPLFLMVFHCFPLFFIVFHGFPGFQVPRARKMKKTWKKNENFLVFEDFLVRSENLQLWVQIFIFFFICNFIFLKFSFVFDGFPLFFIVLFMAFLDFRCHGQGKWKKNDKNMIKNDKKMKKMKKNENFLEFLKISWFGVRICNFESKFSFFFHLQLHFFSFSFVFDGFPLFSIVFHCFSWLSWISGATGKENEKKW